MPCDILPEAGKLRMSKVAAAIESIAEFRPPPGTEFTGFFDYVPIE
jgi:hypothetical protein